MGAFGNTHYIQVFQFVTIYIPIVPLYYYHYKLY